MMPPTEPPDLWPDEISTGQIKAPIAVLREQATALGRKTQNVVVAEIEQSGANYGRQIALTFVLKAPALGDYRFKLFQVTYDPAELYPLFIESEVPLSENKDDRLKADNEHDLLAALKQIFSAPKTVRAIQAIRAQSQGSA